MMWIILQIFIVCLETFIRWKVTHIKRKHRKIGYICGIFAQFFWLAIFLHVKQYYLIILLIINAFIWGRGLLLAFKKDKLKNK